MNEKITFMSASDCYALRCSILHVGVDDVTEQQVKDTISKFYLATVGSHNIRLHDKLILNISQFCNDFINAVDEWLNEIADDNEAQNRMKALLVIHSDEVSPQNGFIVK